MPPPDSTLLTRLAGWFQGHAAGRIEKLRHVASPQLGNRRTITVYLPRGYTHDRAYPLLVAHDGQEMNAWILTDALAKQHAAGRVTPVVAAIPASATRMHEYGTAGQLNGDGLGDRAAEFQAFVTDTVVPLLRRRYQLQRGPAHTAVMGASLGGLSAFDLASVAFSPGPSGGGPAMRAWPSSRPRASPINACARRPPNRRSGCGFRPAPSTSRRIATAMA